MDSRRGLTAPSAFMRTLFDDDDPRPLRRREHPETSHQGAEYAVEHLPKMEARALWYVQRHPGCTENELDDIANVTRRQIGKRCAGLAAKGLIFPGERRPCRITGRPCQTWWPK